MIGTLLGALAILSVSTPEDAHAALLASLPDAKPRVVAMKPIGPIKRRTESMGIKTVAPCAFVADISSGKVLYAKDPHRVMPIASLTKLMTAMVFLDQKPDMTERITFDESDFDGESRSVFFPGEKLTRDEVFTSMLVGSVNASANALARTTLGRDAFVAAMNAKARELKLVSPSFVDPSGLNEGNRANAADVAAILSIASSYPEIRDVTEQGEFSIKGGSGKPYLIKSTNLLINSFLNTNAYKIVAAKTGSLPTSGYSMAQLTMNGDGKQVVAVGLGATDTFSRFQDIKALTAWAFDTYQW